MPDSGKKENAMAETPENKEEKEEQPRARKASAGTRRTSSGTGARKATGKTAGRAVGRTSGKADGKTAGSPSGRRPVRRQVNGTARKQVKSASGKKRRHIKLYVCAFVFVLAIGTALYHANRLSVEYFGTPLSLDVIRSQIRAMRSGEHLPAGDWVYGIDISHHQLYVNWDDLKIYVDENGRTVRDKSESVASEDVDFVFMKATEGVSYRDGKFSTRWKNAGKTTIRRGAYHFFRPGKNVAAQVKNYIDHVGPLSENDLPPVLDIEQTDGCTPAVVNARALEWLKAVERYYGRTPIIYANPEFMRNVLDKELLSSYTIWVAHYRVARPFCKGWTFWQFTDRGHVAGVGVGGVDMNVCPASVFYSMP